MTYTRAMTNPATIGFQKVAIGIDFSGSSDKALELARTQFPHAERLLIHIIDSRATAIPDLSGAGMVPMMPPTELLDTLTQTDSQLLDQVAQEGEYKEVSVGDPTSALVDAARQWGADLLIVGTHTQGAIEHFFVGSVAEQVLKKAHIPVLVMKSEKKAH